MFHSLIELSKKLVELQELFCDAVVRLVMKEVILPDSQSTSRLQSLEWDSFSLQREGNSLKLQREESHSSSLAHKEPS